jgi:cytochrome c oxidase assembly factor CtaG
MADARPFDWHFHLFWSIAIPLLLMAYLVAIRTPSQRATARQVLCFVCGLIVVGVAVLWPLGDLAAHWSLLALVLQRLLLMLAVPPLLVVGTPRPILIRLTRPAPIDAALRIAVRPIAAVAIVTVIAVGTLTTAVVSQTASSEVARIIVQCLVLGAGFVLWAPVMSELPGSKKITSLGRGGYLIVQSIVPSFLSIVWIFANRPLYAVYNHHGTVLGLAPKLDQQLSGFLAKLSTIAVLWTVAFIIMTRGQVFDGHEDDVEPLLWTDVEREIERAERAERRERERREYRPGGTGDPPIGWGN